MKYQLRTEPQVEWFTHITLSSCHNCPQSYLHLTRWKSGLREGKAWAHPYAPPCFVNCKAPDGWNLSLLDPSEFFSAHSLEISARKFFSRGMQSSMNKLIWHIFVEHLLRARWCWGLSSEHHGQITLKEGFCVGGLTVNSQQVYIVPGCGDKCWEENKTGKGVECDFLSKGQRKSSDKMTVTLTAQTLGSARMYSP